MLSIPKGVFRRKYTWVVLALGVVIFVMFRNQLYRYLAAECYGQNDVRKNFIMYMTEVERRGVNVFEPLVKFFDENAHGQDQVVTQGSIHRPDDDLLANVSFSELKHITDSSKLNKTAFTEWSGRLLLQKHGSSFALPSWHIAGKKLCDPDTELVILMPSVPEHQFTREFVRQTWASPLYYTGLHGQDGTSTSKLKLAFIVGSL